MIVADEHEPVSFLKLQVASDQDKTGATVSNHSVDQGNIWSNIIMPSIRAKKGINIPINVPIYKFSYWMQQYSVTHSWDSGPSHLSMEGENVNTTHHPITSTDMATLAILTYFTQ